ncbi:oligosaccharide flippase family protein [Rodentibacter heidelbergensis]|uniref:Flippase n=1 Tax=Rodentibacter heidelbergensis TaxID=1908258 RepID=A0A1V3I6G3_9PAST|nr:oligosaccharide flippase family protein [Rodentibacter heidelbergensis]OOF35584.1 flippase [Rodentibacter heidelbergensis]
MSILKDSSVYFCGELLSKSIPFLLLPYLSKKLGVDGFGELSYYQTFLSLFVIFLGLSQDSAVTRYFYTHGKRSLNLVVNTGYFYTFTLGFFASIFCWVFKSEIMFYLVLSAISQVVLSVQLSVRQCQKQIFSYTLIQLALTSTNTLLTIFILEIYENNLVEKRILAILISNVLVTFLSYMVYKKRIKYKKFTWLQYRISFLYIISFGFPMIFHHFSFFIKTQLDRIFIFHQFSETELGIYSMGVQISSVLSIFIMAINKAVVPYLFERLKEKELNLIDLHRWAFYSLFIIVIILLIIFLIPESFLLFLLGKEFEGVKYYVIMFCFSAGLGIPYVILVNYLFFYGKTKEISFCSVLSTAIYFMALVLFMFTEIIYIPYASILGAIGILPILYFITIKVRKENE